MADIQPTGIFTADPPPLRVVVDGRTPELQPGFLGAAPVAVCSWCGLETDLHVIEGQVVPLAEWHRLDSGLPNAFYADEMPGRPTR